MNAQISPHDTSRFGFPIARATCETPREAQQATDNARELGAELLILRFPAQETSFGPWLHALPNRWTFADTLVYFRRRVERELDLPSEEGLRGRLASSEDAHGIGVLASNSFQGYSSHYRWGPRTDRPNLLGAGYGEWAARLASSSPGFAFVIEAQDGQLAAFACSEIHQDYADTPLAGVAPEYQRRGLYGWLMAATHNELLSRNIRIQEVSTQVHNLAVQKVWIRQGFQLDRASQTVHIDL